METISVDLELFCEQCGGKLESRLSFQTSHHFPNYYLFVKPCKCLSEMPLPVEELSAGKEYMMTRKVKVVECGCACTDYDPLRNCATANPEKNPDGLLVESPVTETGYLCLGEITGATFHAIEEPRS
jgi:hypothetical protein